MYVCVERKYFFCWNREKKFKKLSWMSNFSSRSSKIIILTDKHRFKNNFSISINAPCICRGGSELCILLGTSLVSLATWLLNTATQTISRLADNRDSKVSWIYPGYHGLIDGQLKRTIKVPTDLPNYAIGLLTWRIDDRLIAQTNKRANEFTNEQTYKPTNQWTNVLI